MRLLIDGDACPNKEEIKEIAIKYKLEMLIFIDYAHILEDDYYNVVYCEVGRDSVDRVLLNQVQVDDIVITQDYGLASMVLAKKAIVLHINGMIIDSYNIDMLLMSRYFSAKQRKAGKHTKGPAKRTYEIKIEFLKNLEYLIKKQHMMNSHE